MNVGARVGPYEIVAEIGAGGMGVVYRARDTRLGRDVAIKVSSERFTERFEREARAVAALNHPNICTLHDVGPDYLVMELVEGETLAEMLAHRPRSSPGLPFEDALRLSRQIASALEAAHDKGVIHRDLKPGNVKVTSDGTVKVLDFGLAKFDDGHADPASSDAHQLTNSPTLGGTGVGLILGTAAYMAPEQARGKPVDKRVDIWAFGVVLYEMLTGRRPFVGEDVSTVLAAVIQATPRWDGVPPSMQRLLKKCLEKDPKRRLRDIGDVWHVLDEEPAAAQGPASGYLAWLAAGALALVAAVALWAPWRNSTLPADRPLMRFDVDLGADVALPAMDRPTPSSLAISPDGTRLVYVASVAGAPPRLFTRRLDQSTASELVGTVGAANPFFSPDGHWVGFHDGTRLFKISVEGGAATPLMEAVIFAGATWTNGGDLIVGSGLNQGLLRLAAGANAPMSLIDLAPGELFYTMPQLLPGGRDLLVTVYTTPPGLERAVIDVVSLRDGRRKTIARGGTGARYLPSGHLIYTNASTMFAVPFDLDARETRGTAVPVLNDIAYDPSANLPQYDISADGTLVYRVTANRGPNTARITWLDATGKREALPGQPAEYPSLPRLSPDGKRLAATVREGTSQDIWIYDTERDQRTRLTFGTETFAAPVWSRDGKYVVFGSIGNGLFWARADGGGQPQSLVKRAAIVFPFSFSPDGGRLAFYEVSPTPQIWTVDVDGSDGLKAREPEPFIRSQFAETAPKFSPDGRWLAYESNETGRSEIYVRAVQAAAQGGKWPISNSGGSVPVWSPNGHELLYQSGDQIMSVDYKATNGVFEAGKPRVWLSSIGGAQGFDVAPDGKRLIAFVPTLGSAPKTEHTVVFVQNFFDELRRRVPTTP